VDDLSNSEFSVGLRRGLVGRIWVRKLHFKKKALGPRGSKNMGVTELSDSSSIRAKWKKGGGGGSRGRLSSCRRVGQEKLSREKNGLNKPLVRGRKAEYRGHILRKGR